MSTTRSHKPSTRQLHNRHAALIQAALTAINNVFSDTTVTQGTTIEDLRELKTEIEMKIECIKADIKRVGG